MAHLRTDLDDDAVDFFSSLGRDWFLFAIVDVFLLTDY